MIDLTGEIPQGLPQKLRAAAEQAVTLAADPYNGLDNNPRITAMWLAVASTLTCAAYDLENRLLQTVMRDF